MRLFVMALMLVVAVFHVKHAAADDINQSSWSESDSGNNQAPPAGWPAGMAPSSVEPTARAGMGATKRWYDHQNCTVTSGGSANAQTLTYAVAPQALVAGDTFCFLVGGGLNNTAATTLNINGLGPKAVQTSNGVAFSGGELAAGSYVTVTYDGLNFRLISASNSVVGTFLVHGGAIGLDNNQGLYVKNSSGIYWNALLVDGSNNLVLGSTNYNGQIQFYNNGTEHAVIDSAGSIYTLGGDFHTNNGHGLWIKDNAGNDRNQIILDGTNNLQIGSTLDGGQIQFYNNGSQHGRLDGSGNLSVTGNYQINGSQISCANLSNAAASCSVNATSAANISGTFTTLVTSGNVSLNNGSGVFAKDSGGTYRRAIALDGANNLSIGDSGTPGGICFNNNGHNCQSFIDQQGFLTLNNGNNYGGFNAVSSHTFVGYDGGQSAALMRVNTSPNATYISAGDSGNVIASGSGGGQCVYSGSGNWSCSSDRALKQHIEPLVGGTETIMALKPVSYEWKSNKQEDVGFVAQDVESVLPQLVSGADGDKHLENVGLIAPLVAAVQELSKRVDELEAELKANKR